MSIKQEALQALSDLPETANWNDIIYTLYIKQKISSGLIDINEGKTVSHEDAIRALIPNAY